MNMRSISLAALGAALVAVGAASATPPQITLGPKAAFGLFQPRVQIEVFEDQDGLQSLGPTSSNVFLLDTGANGDLIFSSATEQLKQAGYQVEGTIQESGVTGVEEFEVSAPYRLDYVGTDGVAHSLADARLLSTDTGVVDPTGLLDLHGIVGMPAMAGRVTTLDNRSTEGALTLSMGVSFADTLPLSDTQRFSVPLSPLEIPFEGEGPLPTSAPLATLNVTSRSGDLVRSDDLVLDSGAQMTIISQRMAFGLGLDANGDGDLSDDAQSFVPIGGVGGTIQATVLGIDELRVRTDQGFELVWHDAQVIVQDIDPRIEGVFGADMLTGDGGLDLNALGSLGGGNTGDLLSGLLGTDGLGDLLGGLLGDDSLGDLLGELLGGGGDLEDLLGGLLGGSGGLGDLFGDLGGVFDGFPLESHFDRVHFDFRGFPEGAGRLVLDVNPEISGEILNGDGLLDFEDINALAAAINSTDLRYDLDGDGTVGTSDHSLLITEVFQTLSGDANLDGSVDFADFVALADRFGGHGGWESGDFDANGLIDFTDFTLLAENFGTVAGATTAASVPEPSGWLLAVFLFVTCLRGSVRR